MRPTNYLRQNTVYSYSEMSFFFLIVSSFFAFFFVFFLLFYVILLLFIFTKTMSLLSLINFFFMKITFIFSCSGMFRDVPECSGMFHVPGFIDALKKWRRLTLRSPIDSLIFSLQLGHLFFQLCFF